MRRMLVSKLATFFAAATLMCWGQDRGTILGRVTDPSSAVIAGATITAIANPRTADLIVAFILLLLPATIAQSQSRGF